MTYRKTLMRKLLRKLILNFLFRNNSILKSLRLNTGKQEVKTAIDNHEKDALLLDLITIAFNEELGK